MTRILSASIALVVALLAAPTISQACGGGYGRPQRVQHDDSDAIRTAAGEHLTGQNLRAVTIPTAFVALGIPSSDEYRMSVTAWSGSLSEGHGERHVLTLTKRRGDWRVTATESVEVVEGLTRTHVLNAERDRAYQAISRALATNAQHVRGIQHFEVNSSGRRAVMVVELSNGQAPRRFTLRRSGAGFRIIRQVSV